MDINNDFDIGQMVYVKTDPEQREWIISSLIVSQNEIGYRCSFIDASATFESFELTAKKDLNKSLGIDDKMSTK